MAIIAAHAWWFAPFVLPICLYVAYTDMARMKITNRAVMALVIVFAVIGLFLMPIQAYMWQLIAMAIVLVVGIVLNAAGVMGAGDAKFIAAAAPYIALGDLQLVIALLMAVLLLSVAVHRGVKYSPLRRLAPEWESWERGKKFPMGLPLGMTLSAYLVLGALYGA
ncbi:MAG: prepilin peptidase [Pseudomonadota bacterium]